MTIKKLSLHSTNKLNKYCTAALCIMFTCAMCFFNSLETKKATGENLHEFYFNVWFILFLLLAVAYTAGVVTVNLLRPVPKQKTLAASNQALAGNRQAIN